jgi:hypothetical protein
VGGGLPGAIAGGTVGYLVGTALNPTTANEGAEGPCPLPLPMDKLLPGYDDGDNDMPLPLDPYPNN